MLKKENQPPTKQGVFYQLNLNKNNGPYLSKDIMYNNTRSNTLLTTPAILNEHKKMVETLNQLQKTVKTCSGYESKTDNFTVSFERCEQQLNIANEVSQFLHQQQHNLKYQMGLLQERISQSNNQLIESTMPILKNLLKCIKQVNQRDRAQYYTFSKELQQIQMQKRTLEHVVLSCRLKIEQLQIIFGVADKTSLVLFENGAVTTHSKEPTFFISTW